MGEDNWLVVGDGWRVGRAGCNQRCDLRHVLVNLSDYSDLMEAYTWRPLPSECKMVMEVMSRIRDTMTVNESISEIVIRTDILITRNL